jgi:hypothetical protein
MFYFEQAYYSFFVFGAFIILQTIIKTPSILTEAKILE